MSLYVRKDKREDTKRWRLKDEENLYLDYEEKAISKVGNGDRQSVGATYVVVPNHDEKQKPGEPPCEQFVQCYSRRLTTEMVQRTGVWEVKWAECAFGAGTV